MPFLNGKAAQVVLFKASDYTEVQLVSTSLMKSGYIGLAIDENGKILVDAIATLHDDPKTYFGLLFANAENQVTSKESFNLGFSFYLMDKKGIQKAVKIGSLISFIAPKAVMLEINKSAQTEEF